MTPAGQEPALSNTPIEALELVWRTFDFVAMTRFADMDTGGGRRTAQRPVYDLGHIALQCGAEGLGRSKTAALVAKLDRHAVILSGDKGRCRASHAL